MLETETGGSREMPKYRSHKEVWALKIKEINNPHEKDEDDSGRREIIPDELGFAAFTVDHDYMRKHKPEVGGYYVVYKDGYKSYSPQKPFEDGYTKI